MSFVLLLALICAANAFSAPFLSLRRPGALIASGSELEYKALYHYSQRRTGRSALRSPKKIWIGCDEIFSGKSEMGSTQSWNWVGTSNIGSKSSNDNSNVHWPSGNKVWTKNAFPSTECSSLNGTSICSKVFPESGEIESNSVWPEEGLAGKTISKLKVSWKWLRRQFRISSKPFPPAKIAEEERTPFDEENDDRVTAKKSNKAGNWFGENEISSKTFHSDTTSSDASVEWPLDNQLVSRAVEVLHSLWFGEKEVCSKSAPKDSGVSSWDEQADEKMWTKTFSRFLSGWLWEKDDSIKTKVVAQEPELDL